MHMYACVSCEHRGKTVQTKKHDCHRPWGSLAAPLLNVCMGSGICGGGPQCTWRQALRRIKCTRLGSAVYAAWLADPHAKDGHSRIRPALLHEPTALDTPHLPTSTPARGCASMAYVFFLGCVVPCIAWLAAWLRGVVQTTVGHAVVHVRGPRTQSWPRGPHAGDGRPARHRALLG